MDGEHDDRGIRIAIAVYLYALFALLAVAIVQIWPSHALFGEDAKPLPASILFFKVTISDEMRLLTLVILLGAIGSLAHSFRSFYWHVVRPGKWTPSWLIRYYLQPPAGATIALVFYLFVRAGFWSPDPGGEEEDLVWIAAALAVMVGMFKEQGASKLKDIAEAVLKKPPARDDSAASSGNPSAKE
jgi:hypothetical protein